MNVIMMMNDAIEVSELPIAAISKFNEILQLCSTPLSLPLTIQLCDNDCGGLELPAPR